MVVIVLILVVRFKDYRLCRRPRHVRPDGPRKMIPLSRYWKQQSVPTSQFQDIAKRKGACKVPVLKILKTWRGRESANFLFSRYWNKDSVQSSRVEEHVPASSHVCVKTYMHKCAYIHSYAPRTILWQAVWHRTAIREYSTNLFRDPSNSECHIALLSGPWKKQRENERKRVCANFPFSRSGEKRESVQSSRFQYIEKESVQSSLAEDLENTNRESVQSSRFQDIERERERAKERKTNRQIMCARSPFSRSSNRARESEIKRVCKVPLVKILKNNRVCQLPGFKILKKKGSVQSSRFEDFENIKRERESVHSSRVQYIQQQRVCKAPVLRILKTQTETLCKFAFSKIEKTRDWMRKVPFLNILRKQRERERERVCVQSFFSIYWKQ